MQAPEPPAPGDYRPLFAPWFDQAVRLGGVLAVGGVAFAAVCFGYVASPKTTDVGYQPEQPVPYSHKLHAGDLGIDCRYCHTGVEVGARATIPPTETCINCHHAEKGLLGGSAKLAPVQVSYETGMPVPWVRVHDLADFAYFNHSAHVRRGVGCISCHGPIHTMEVVYQAEPLSMGWCLDCHRNPEPHLRPTLLVTAMRHDWRTLLDREDEATRTRVLAEFEAAKKLLAPSTDCSTCHR